LKVFVKTPRPRRRSSRPEDDEPLPPALTRELKRRMKDLHDPTRYVVVSAFSPRFLLYYSLSNDTYSMNDFTHATLFKRPSIARAVMGSLGSGHVLMKVRMKKGGGLTRVTPLRELLRSSRSRSCKLAKRRRSA
jgi:hypothetical protein